MMPQVTMGEVFRPDCCEIYKAYGKNEHINAIAKKTGIDIKVPHSRQFSHDMKLNHKPILLKLKIDRDHYPGHDLLWQPDEQHVVCGRHEWPNGGLHPRRGYSRSLWGELLQEYRSYRKEGRITDLKWCRKGSLFFQRQERSWVQHPHGGDNLVRPRFNCVYSASAAPLLIANYIICSWCDENSVPKDWNGYLSCNYFSCSRIIAKRWKYNTKRVRVY